MEALVPFVMIAAFIGIFVAGFYAEKGRKQRRDAVWSAVADNLDGEYDSGEHGFWRRDEPAVWATIDGVEVHADTITKGSGKNKTTYTRIRATSTAPHEVSMKVYREGVFSGLARAVGFQDVQIGDPVFDDTFIIKASDEVYARAWLNATVRKRLLRAGDYSFHLRRGRIFAERSGEENGALRLERTMRAVAAFADGKHHVVRIFKKLAKSLGGKARKESRRWASLRADVDGTPVTVDTLEHGTSHFNVVTANVVGAKLTPLVITNDVHEFSPTLPAAEMHDLPDGYAAWTFDPERAAAQLTDEVKSQIDALQPIKVRIDEEQVRVLNEGICPPLRDMRAAIELAATIAASTSTTPYR